MVKKRSKHIVNSVIVLVLLLCLSCKESKKKIITINPPKKIVENQTTPEVVAEAETAQSEPELFAILLPNSYRIGENDDPTKELNTDWFDLFEKDGNFFIEKAKYTISKGYDECVGTETKSIDTKRKTLLLLDYKKLVVGKIDHLAIPNQYIWPKEKQEFVFNNQKYSLRAEGRIKSTERIPGEEGQKDQLWHNVEDYKLFIKTETAAEELLLSEKGFNDTFVKLLFVGDLDKDGKLDFIFEANRDYEEDRVILFLSSEAKGNKVEEKVSEISIQHDC